MKNSHSSGNPVTRFQRCPQLGRQRPVRIEVRFCWEYVRFPLSLRNVEDLLFERGIDISHETVRLWRTRFGPLFAADILRQRVSHMRGFRQWKWHLDEV